MFALLLAIALDTLPPAEAHATTTAPPPTTAPTTAAPPTTTTKATASATTSAPDAPAPKLRVLVLDLQSVGVSGDDARLLSGVVAALAAENPHVEIITGADLRRAVDLAAAKQDLGCDDATCLADLAGALD